VKAVISQQSGSRTPVPSVTTKPGTPATSTSVTGQFVIHGADLNTRGDFCLLCDETAASLGKLLRDDGKFLIPVVVVLKIPPDIALGGPAISTNISQLAHGGFHLQMNVQLRGDFNSEDFARELVRVLLAERILRNHKELQTTRQRVLPDWLLTGVTQALEFRNRSKPSAFFAAVFRRGQVYTVDKVLTADPSQLDSLARGIYETSSCALVLALLDQPDGPLRFSKFLNALALDNKPDRELLKESFTTLGASRNSLEKWWSLQMAALATPTAMESLSVEDTEKGLDEALTLRFDPLPQDSKKEKTKPAAKPAPAAEPPAPDSKKKEPRKPLFSPPTSSLPYIGGKKISFVPKPETDTDASPEKEPDTKDKPKKSSAETTDEPPGKLKAKPHRVAQRPSDLPKIAPAANKPKEESKKPKDEPTNAPTEEELGKTRSKLNPLNWFRGKEKPADESKPESVPKSPVAKNQPKKTDESPVMAKHNAGPSIEEYALIAKRPDREKILEHNLDLLGPLKLHANPLYRPLIAEYADIIRLLMKGKDKNATEKLAELRKRRIEIAEKAKAVESYTDWYEASETKNYSGTFEDYLRLHDKIDREIRPRTDAISKYLDALAKEYE
ncbi:MAG: hypothetical protein WCN98_16525, partial [Verrucomicrobiaceae bacterium]